MHTRREQRSRPEPGPVRTWADTQGYTTSLPGCVRTMLGTHRPSQHQLRQLVRNWWLLTPDALTCPVLRSARLLDHIERDLPPETQSVLVALLPSSMTLGDLSELATRV